jgi:hypothetical protein
VVAPHKHFEGCYAHVIAALAATIDSEVVVDYKKNKDKDKVEEKRRNQCGSGCGAYGSK